ncbi:hypothetical protein N7499_008236 [Penicillium canescens]|nr:hypothetical protein N7499_008236 [Penicillium canescens]KAJ6158567.1 hypothetical protein N7485_011393 [Penicillium canescens]
MAMNEVAVLAAELTNKVLSIPDLDPIFQGWPSISINVNLEALQAFLNHQAECPRSLPKQVNPQLDFTHASFVRAIASSLQVHGVQHNGNSFKHAPAWSAGSAYGMKIQNVKFSPTTSLKSASNARLSLITWSGR